MTPPDRLVRPFSDVRADDVAWVGGKGANLGELAAIGMPVPPGFCVTTAAFDEFLSSCPDIDALYALLDTVTAHDVSTSREVGQQVRTTLLSLPAPSHVEQAVVQEWRALDEQQAYAVRSSATAEDLPGASFAGQQDTYLNIRGEAALLDAVRRCWVSLFTDRAILYRVQNGYSHRQVQLAVVVQQMVLAEASGVLFTADPVTGHRPTVVIDAGFGLGESLVSGLVAPDSYRVDKRARRILDRDISYKETAIVPVEDGGTRQVQLPESRRSLPVLNDHQILDLAEIGMRTEAHYGAPQDLEWAVVAGEISVLQARPITSLFPVDGVRSPDDSLHIYFNMGYQQNMTRAMSPLGMSCVRSIVPLGHAQNEVESSYVRTNGGRLFADLTVPLRHPVFRRAVMEALSQFDATAPASLQLAMQRPEFHRPTALVPPAPAVRALAQLIARVQAALWWQQPSGVVAEVDDLVAQHVRAVESRLHRTTYGEAQVIAVIDVLRSFIGVVLQWAPRFAAGMIAHRLLVRLGRDWADPGDLAAYNVGLPGNVVTEMTLALGDLADAARRSPELVEWFDQLADDSQTWLAGAAQIEDGRHFLRQWEQFLDRYGCRGSAEIDIRTPRWYEEPLPLLKTLAGYLDQAPGSHRTQQEALGNAAREAGQRLVAGAAHGAGGAVRSRLVRRLVAVSQTGSVLREHHKFMAVQILRAVKETMKQTAGRLAEAGRLNQPDDIWFLSLPEVLALVRGDGVDVAERVAARRAELAEFDAIAAPMVLTSDGETPVVRYHVEDAPPGALLGQPVSGGVVEAQIRVILDPQTETLNPGEVLVAPFTDPGWTPLFGNASGLVTEIGGLLTHGSVVAREYGIPAVVGVREATTRLRTGQRVRVDGSRGIVEILDSA